MSKEKTTTAGKKSVKKVITGRVRLELKAGEANPGVKVGPALGQHGVNLMEFCKAFNAQTQSFEKGVVIGVVVSVYNDRSFTFALKKAPPAAYLLIKASGAKKGSSTPHTDKVGTLSLEQLQQLAHTKGGDLTAASLDAAVKTLAGTARSAGITLEETRG